MPIAECGTAGARWNWLTTVQSQRERDRGPEGEKKGKGLASGGCCTERELGNWGKGRTRVVESWTYVIACTDNWLMSAFGEPWTWPEAEACVKAQKITQ